MKYEAIYVCIRSLIFTSGLIPRKLLLSLGSTIGKLAYKFMHKTRNLTIEHLKMAYAKDLSEPEIAALSRKVFINIGKNAMDTIQAYNVRKLAAMEKIVSVEGIGHFDQALAQGKGLIALACHRGAFELIADVMTLKGYKTNVMGAALQNKKLDELLVNYRTAKGAKYIQIGQETLSVIKALKKGEVLAILIDQDKGKVKGTFVNFFDKPAYTPIGAALLALKTGASVVPTAIRRLPDDTHRITFLPALELIRTGQEELDLKVNTQLFTRYIEAFIREVPEEWVWMHERWKHQPEQVTDYAVSS
jgi:Kdo2-lipid IVA lauroyltransferase/acyltransferase